MEFKDRLKTIRKEKGMTQHEVELNSGLAINTLKQYESGKRLPNYCGIIALCKGLDVSADYLLGISYSYTK